MSGSSNGVHFAPDVRGNGDTTCYDDDSDTDDSSAQAHRHARVLLKRSFSLVPERLGNPASNQFVTDSRLAWCEVAMKVAAFTLFIMTIPLSLILCLKVIAQYERAVIFRLGRLLTRGARGPGLIFVLPCLDSIKRIDLRTFTFDVPTQEVLTKDSVTVAVDAVVYYRIFDPVMSVVNVEEANRSTRLLAATTLRNVLGTVDLYCLLTDREDIAGMMQESLDAATDTWGVKVERVEVKDVRLPIQLQRAMAAEAEATREAKAKVIAAEGEQLASKALKLAAIELSECPIALQLRYLQTLNSISVEKNSTIIFPLPFDVMQQFNTQRKKPQPRKRRSTPVPSAPPARSDSNGAPPYDLSSPSASRLSSNGHSVPRSRDEMSECVDGDLDDGDSYSDENDIQI